MMASEHHAKDSLKDRLKKLNSKYSKFTAALEKRRAIVSNSVAMYKGISEVLRPGSQLMHDLLFLNQLKKHIK